MLNTNDMTLYAKQLELESKMTEMGRERFLSTVNKKQQQGLEADTRYGQRLLSSKGQALLDALTEWVEHTETAKGRGAKPIAYQKLKDADLMVVTVLAMRGVLNNISRPVPLTTMAHDIGKLVRDELSAVAACGDDMKLLKTMSDQVSKRGIHQSKAASVRAILRREGIEWEKWTKPDTIKVGLFLLEMILIHTGLIDVTTKTIIKRGKQSTTRIVRATPAVIEWITNSIEWYADMMPLYGLMIVPPKPWTSPVSGGYLSDNVRSLNIVKTRNKSYLRDLESVDMPAVYDALNKVQATAWQIDEYMVSVVDQCVDKGISIGKLPPAVNLEMPVKPHDIETNKQARAQYRREKHKVMEAMAAAASQHASVAMIRRMAHEYAQYDAVWMPWQLDFRGRLYPVPRLNPQGADWTKCMLHFAEAKPLGERGARWLAIHIANLAGVDKVDFDSREMWTHMNSQDIIDAVADPFENDWWMQTDKPFQFLQAAREWVGYLEQGESFESRIAVALDGSCSGLQNFSMALRDAEGGAAVNLLPSDKPRDIYQDVIDKVISEMEKIMPEYRDDMTREEAEAIALKAVAKYKPKGMSNRAYKELLVAVDYDDTIMKRKSKGKDIDKAEKIYRRIVLTYLWRKFGLSRSVAKSPVMTFPYGSKQFGFRDQILERVLRKKKVEAKISLQQGHISGDEYLAQYPFADTEEWDAAGLMAELIWKGVTQTVSKAAEAMDWLQQLARMVTQEGQVVTWHTPLGFLVRQDYWASATKQMRAVFLGKRLAPRFSEPTGNVDKRKSANAIAPNVIHSLDASHMMLTVVRAKGIENFSLIHDSYGTHACDTDDLFKAIRNAFVELYTDNVFDRFRDEIMSQMSWEQQQDVPPTPEYGELELSSVLDSDYCFA